MVISTVFLWLSLCCIVTTFADTKTIDINIPNSAWDGNRSLLCNTAPVDPHQYIISYEPLYRKHTIRHISAVICDHPSHINQVWDCGQGTYVCENGENEVLWAMAKDGPGWHLPKEFAVPIGSKKRYLVLQIHAPPNMKLESTSSFNSTGIRIGLTDRKPTYRSDIAIYGMIGYIPANAKDFTADAFCWWPFDDTPLYGISIHSHTMATAITGYIYRNNHFIELLRADPSYPEVTIDISSRNITLQSTDILIMRCTLTNPNRRDVKFGNAHVDEMCDLYFFYGTKFDAYKKHRHVLCPGDAQKSDLSKLFAHLPQDSTVPDEEGYKKLLSPFNVTKSTY
ncbi:peptidyl-glycine alpha-amidating monooxygenase B-like isoform X1 [Octopus vulgaris]|uniref:Peptidyl-glycine alpha-amidating monooxygenase B-like isoform X1 n=1 Tax=Octopus vulgaris TaxID=6645 RepID=A0AA36B7H3_OCTVU|nr:peptidyl-glycine alpha-amidating monooxygenase B-like isoform X1 [Octopus vulgaris]